VGEREDSCRGDNRGGVWEGEKQAPVEEVGLNMEWDGRKRRARGVRRRGGRKG